MRSSRRLVGWLSAGILVGCGGAAHSLGGDEQRQGEGNVSPSVATGGDSHPATGGDPGVGLRGEPLPATGWTSALGPAGACDPASCGSFVAVGETFAGCCLEDGSCGVYFDPYLAGYVRLPGEEGSGPQQIQAGCQHYNQVGVPNVHCRTRFAPDMSNGGQLTLEGCCRSDGTCGNDLSIIRMGCVQASRPAAVLDGGGVEPPELPVHCDFSNASGDAGG